MTEIHLAIANNKNNTLKLEPKDRARPNNFNRLFGDNVKDITIGPKFYDLTPINQTCSQKYPSGKIVNPTRCISKIRMRPLFFNGSSFFFNGHYEFSGSGASEDPKIGTTEDWYLINTIFLLIPFISTS